jgi:hypothetical protein
MSGADGSPEQGLETVPAGEAEAVDVVVRLVAQQLRGDYAGVRPALRAQHAQSHGSVEAEFVVAHDVPEDLRHGLFARPATYPAWVRFSGSSAPPSPGSRFDAQGMAIKVLGVGAGGQADPGAATTSQDFVLVNLDVFFCRDALDYAAFATMLTTRHRVLPRLQKVLRMVWFFARRGQLRQLGNLVRVKWQRVANPLRVRYWSQTPFALGPHAVKYSVRPRRPLTGGHRLPPGNDALQTALARQLSSRGATFDFLVQRQRDAATMPVEDPTVPWDEAASPFRRVATIRIPAQPATDRERRNVGERLRFSPWQTLDAHRPLGGINRARRAAYEESARLRHEMNGRREAFPPEPPAVRRPA